MENKIDSSKVISSFFWKFIERCGVQGMQFVIQIILARLLLPEEYGLISIVTIFIVIANVFIHSGFSTSLVQKKELDEGDYDTVFCISLIVSIIMYFILFISAPYIAIFYAEPRLKYVLRVISITLVIGAFSSIQNAIIARNMLFNKLLVSSLSSVVLSGTVSIICAYIGMGVWALVIQYILSQLISTIILLVSLNWTPRFWFSLTKAKRLLSYGWKMLISGLVDSVYQNLQGLIIGTIYSTNMLAYYNRGKQFPELIVGNINGSIQSVIFPMLSLEQDNKKNVKELTRRSIITSTFFVFPLMMGMAITSEPLVSVLLTDKWANSVPYLRVFCAVFCMWPIHTINLQAINALGRSDIFLKLELIKKTIGIITLLITVNIGVYAMAIGVLINSVISCFINTYPNRKLLNYKYKEQLFDILPNLLLTLITGVFIYAVIWPKLTSLLTLIIQFFIGIIFYLGIAKMLKLKSFSYLISMLNVIIGKKTVKNE